MIPEPLHPSVVHFPVVFGLFLPLFALYALWSARGGGDQRRAWRPVVLLSALLALSSFAATRTGEMQEDKVEDRVSEEAFEAHEEGAEFAFYLSLGVFVLAAGGLMGGGLGNGARILGTVGAIAVALAMARTGHSGGELAYKHGAAALYAQPGAGVDAAGQSDQATEGEGSEDGDDDDGG